MTSKQRAYLKSLAASIDPVFSIGKAGITTELTEAVSDALRARELIKITVLKSCEDALPDLAETLAGRTRSFVVQVIGRKIVLYKPAREAKDRKIILPPQKRLKEES